MPIDLCYPFSEQDVLPSQKIPPFRRGKLADTMKAEDQPMGWCCPLSASCCHGDTVATASTKANTMSLVMFSLWMFMGYLDTFCQLVNCDI